MTRLTRNRPAVALGVAAAIAASFASTAAGHASSPGTPVLAHDGLASTSPYGSAVPVDYSKSPPAPDLASNVQPNTEIEPSIAVNPSNPKDIVAAFQVGRVDAGGDADNGFATSVDGGASWTQGLLPGLTKDTPAKGTIPPGPFDRASDAVVAFGPSGSNLVYASSLVFDDTTQSALPSGMAINVSKDGGVTWSAPVFLEQDNLAGLNDKNWVVVDNGTGTGHHTGRVYVVWDRVAPMVYAYCDPDRAGAAVQGCDQLSNWSSAAASVASPGQTNGFYTFGSGPGISSYPLVQSDGSLSIVYEEDYAGNPVGVSNTDQPTLNASGKQIEITTAKLAGAVVWPAPLTFALADTHPVGTYTSASGVQEQRAGSLITAAIDPTSNQMYAGWEDSTRRTTDKLNDAVFVTSKDGGVTWSAMAPIDPNADGSFLDDYNPSLAVGTDGTLRAIYRERHEPAGALSNTIDTFYQQSTDGGATWSTPLKIDTQATNVNYGAYSRGGLFEGDYDQVAVGSDGTAYAVRDEAYAQHAGDPPAWPRAGSTFMDPPSPNEFQATWVAAITPGGPAVNVPDARWVPALVLLGAAAAVVALRRRRRGHAAA